MIQYSDSSGGEDEKEKRVNKAAKVLTKALPQEQAMIRFKYRGIWTPI